MEGRRCIQLFRFMTPISRSRVIAPIRAVCTAGTAQRALSFACTAASGPTFLCIDCASDSVGIPPPPPPLDRRNGHSLALRRTVAAGPPPWASKNGHWPPQSSPQGGAPATAGGASAPTLKLGAPPPNPHLNMVVVC